ncbi:MAG TPA: hypothetical protein VGJ81_05575 [Thermoanaerobaculia bacterium]|jgi:hypothetical protein
MSEPRLSVRQLLDMPKGTDVLAGLPEDDLKSVRNAVKGMEWSTVESAVGDSLAEALDIDPITLFAAAWEKYALLSDAAKESRDGAKVLVPLAEHAVKSELHPYVEIQVGPITRRIEFDVTLSLKLKGVVVNVQSEEIRGIEAGTCEGTAEIGLASHSIWKHDIKPIALPGKVTLKDSIPIR